MTRQLVALAAALGLAGLLLAAPALAQPTFGKPKRGERPERAEPDTTQAPDAAPADPLLASTANPAAPGWKEWREEDPERAAPSADAEPGKPFAWKSHEGMRYTWVLPQDFQRGQGYDLIVLCHPDKSDFRWGTLNHPAPALAGARAFCPGDIVVAIDGTSAAPRNPDIRSFAVTPEAIVQFRDLVLEISRTFPVNRIYIYGMGGGGAFAQCFATAFPALADGVVAHGCTVPSDCVKKGATPIVLLHGAKDLLVPLSVSFDARRAFDDAEHRNVRVRVLQSFNDFPNPVRAGECIDWVRAMRTDEPDQLLAAVRRMLTPKPADEYEYRAPVWFGAARVALGRLVGEGEDALKDVPTEAAAAARTLIDKIEAEGAKHVAVLRALLAPGVLADQPLDGKPWLGHLVALREDFRGVRSVEAFLEAIGYDSMLIAHDDAALGLRDAWLPDGDAKATFETAADAITECWLSQFLPLDLGPRMRFWARKSGELNLAADAMEKFEYLQNWEQGWKEGLNAYEDLWRKWDGPG